MTRRLFVVPTLATGLLLAGASPALIAQGRGGGGPVLDRLATMAPYQQFVKRQPLYQNPMVTGALNVTWVDGGRAFTYNFAGKAYRFDATTMQTAVTGEVAEAAEAGGRGAGRGGGVAAGGRGGGRGGAATNDVCPQEAVDRGRQRTCYGSPDGTMRAYYRDRNLWVSAADGSNAKQITTDGDEKKRTKNGSGSWVYGEELGQTTAIWWSPDSKQVAFYRFDESPVK